MRRRRAWTVPALVVVLAAVALAAIILLQERSDADRRAQTTVSTLRGDLQEMNFLPLRMGAGAPPEQVRSRMAQLRREMTAELDDLIHDRPIGDLAAIGPVMRANLAGMEQLRQFMTMAFTTDAGRRAYGEALMSGAPTVGGPGTELVASVGQSRATVDHRLDQAAAQYASRAAHAHRESRLGTVLALLLLVLAFLLAYRRSTEARARAEAMAAEHRREALTDALTGLPNRRALALDVEQALASRRDDEQLVLSLFDLDGFKHYNDSFGHGAGDALLARLGGRLRETVRGVGVPYRMGGDEFCLVSREQRHDGDVTARLAAAALSESGEGFVVGCSFGSVILPDEARTASDALRLADARMYEQKRSGHRSATRQTADVLVRVLAEQSGELEEHAHGVAALASAAAERLGLESHEVATVRLAAELHDVGKAAIPREILRKATPLDERDWAFIRSHTTIGERIVLAAPALAGTAPLVRASHERVDGTGYPDGLAGEAIPLGARIIAVCDAFDAMVTDRPYRQARSVDDAVAELRRCAGTQFDPEVVEVICDLVQPGHELMVSSGPTTGGQAT
jgi:diguanylate cyclase (GGDEF)-like protein